MARGSHYAHYSQDPDLLFKVADKLAETFITQYPTKQPVLVYQGFSGITLATGLGMSLLTRGITPGYMYIRKDSEDSHGSAVETGGVQRDCVYLPEKDGWDDQLTFDPDTQVLVFVDDFTSSGRTLQRLMIRLQDKFKLKATPENSVILLWKKTRGVDSHFGIPVYCAAYRGEED